MKAITVLGLLTKYAHQYRKIAKDSIVRNKHMNNINTNIDIEQDTIDALLVDFINFIGIKYGIDYALYTKDINKDEIND